MAVLSPDNLQRIAIIRQKAADGIATLEDYREFVAITRQGRLSALAASDSAKKSKAVKVIPNAEDLLDELIGGQTK